MKNITLSADEDLIDRARLVAKTNHTTLNEAFREWLVDFTSRPGTVEHYDSLMSRITFKVDRKFTREEMNER